MTAPVLMLPTGYPPVVGGAERQADKLSRALVARGTPVRVLTPRLHPDQPIDAEEGGVPVHRFPLPALPPWRGLGPLRMALFGRALEGALDRALAGVEIVHGHQASWVTALGLAHAKRRGRLTLCKMAVGTPDLTDVEALRRSGGFGRWLAGRLLSSVDRWILTTSAGRESLAREGVDPRAIEVIPNGVALPPPELSWSPRPPRRILYLGRLARNINRDASTLLRAFDELCEGPVGDLELALIGGGDLLEETRGMIAGLTHAARVVAPGFQDPARWLEWADIFVLPSRIEGMSNALIEAMAQGLPCVANNIAPNAETLGQAGLLVEIGDVAGLRDALNALIADPALAARLGRAARRRAEDRFSLDAVAARYTELYASMRGGS